MKVVVEIPDDTRIAAVTIVTKDGLHGADDLAREEIPGQEAMIP